MQSWTQTCSELCLVEAVMVMVQVQSETLCGLAPGGVTGRGACLVAPAGLEFKWRLLWAMEFGVTQLPTLRESVAILSVTAGSMWVSRCVCLCSWVPGQQLPFLSALPHPQAH